MYLLGIYIWHLVIAENIHMRLSLWNSLEYFYFTGCEFSILLLKVMPLAVFCCIIHSL